MSFLSPPPPSPLPDLFHKCYFLLLFISIILLFFLFFFLLFFPIFFVKNFILCFFFLVLLNRKIRKKKKNNMRKTYLSFLFFLPVFCEGISFRFSYLVSVISPVLVRFVTCLKHAYFTNDFCCCSLTLVC